MITKQPSLWGSEPREDKSLDRHLEPVTGVDGRLWCPKCRAHLNRKCPERCPECGQAIDRRKLK